MSKYDYLRPYFEENNNYVPEDLIEVHISPAEIADLNKLQGFVDQDLHGRKIYRNLWQKIEAFENLKDYLAAESRQKYASGGRVKDIRPYGRYCDTEVALIPHSMREFLDEHIGASINPDTGKPEYFLGNFLSGIGNYFYPYLSHLGELGKQGINYVSNRFGFGSPFQMGQPQQPSEPEQGYFEGSLGNLGGGIGSTVGDITGTGLGGYLGLQGGLLAGGLPGAFVGTPLGAGLGALTGRNYGNQYGSAFGRSIGQGLDYVPTALSNTANYMGNTLDSYTRPVRQGIQGIQDFAEDPDEYIRNTFGGYDDGWDDYDTDDEELAQQMRSAQSVSPTVPQTPYQGMRVNGRSYQDLDSGSEDGEDDFRSVGSEQSDRGQEDMGMSWYNPLSYFYPSDAMYEAEMEREED